VAACVAPSFPAEFAELDYRQVVGMLRVLGFSLVTEVSFGADLVADRYRHLLDAPSDRRYIATTCPAVVGYVERYFPAIVDHLAPIVSPMIAAARVLKARYGDDLQIVFIGPCVAKKLEAADPAVGGEIHSVLTFRSLRKMFKTMDIHPEDVAPDDFDPPHGGSGSLFSLNRGLLQAADIHEDLASGEVLTADGLDGFVSAIAEFAGGTFDGRLLEVLSCNGCVMGPGMTTAEPRFRRHSRVSRYVQFRRRNGRVETNRRDMEQCANLNLNRTFTARDQREPAPSENEVRDILVRLGKNTPGDELNCGACGYDTCREHAVAIHKGLAEDEMCLPHIIDRLKVTIRDLSDSHAQLATAQDQLMHSEKLASMGQLAAGVAHELNNPLGVVLMYSHLLLDDLDAGSPLYGDLRLIAEQAQRSKKIVSNLLDFARENKVLLEEVNLEEVLRRSAEVTRGLQRPLPVFEFGHRDPVCEIDPDQMTQVFTNIINNACGAMGDDGQLIIRTTDSADEVAVAFIDNGCGIPEENLTRVFQPFFTTKKIGKGTGLGLAVSYGIVKMHRGSIEVLSNADRKKGPTGTTFTVKIPRRQRAS